MDGENFSDNLLRLIAAQQAFSLGMQVARELFGRSYFQLGAAEKAIVDQTLLAHVGSNYTSITAPWLQSQQAAAQPVGFQPSSTAGKDQGS